LGRSRKPRIVTDIKLTGIADKGRAVGRDSEGMVYFVSGAVPGDVVDVFIRKKRSSYRIGEVSAIKSYSDLRVKAFCSHFGNCGGCKWQDLAYTSQLKFKEQAVIDAFERIGDLTIEETFPIIACEEIKYYRNKLEYSFSDRRWVPKEELDKDEKITFGPATGFHRAGAFNKIVQIDKCYLQADLSNQIRNFVHQFAIEHNYTFYNAKEHHGLLRNLLVRNTTTEDWMVAMIFGENEPEQIEELMKALTNEFEALTSVFYVINTKLNDSLFDQSFIHYKGENTITEKLGHINYKIGPKSFFQTNTRQAKILYDKVVEFADLKGDELVFDLYTGLGSIALYLADKCFKVVGIEEIEQAIKDANLNKNLNQIDNAEFVVGDCKKAFNQSFLDAHGQPDLIIVDPPRAGLHQAVVDMIKTTKVDRIIYVSCNPSTQARDIALLADAYNLTKIQPVDMFPHTHHIENIACLVKKSL